MSTPGGCRSSVYFEVRPPGSALRAPARVRQTDRQTVAVRRSSVATHATTDKVGRFSNLLR